MNLLEITCFLQYNNQAGNRWRVRQVVKPQPSQGCITGSNPVHATNFLITETRVSVFLFLNTYSELDAKAGDYFVIVDVDEHAKLHFKKSIKNH